MKEYTVTYYLTPEQEAAINELTGECVAMGRSWKSSDAFFNAMMQTGSSSDIDARIELWQRTLMRNEQRQDEEVAKWQEH